MQHLAPKSYRSDVKPTWCEDCGDYKVLDAITEAFSELNIKAHDTVMVAGVGCSSRLPFYTKTYGFHTIHGRALPIATGIKVANPERTVITVGGDGDGFSIGGNHFIHTSRKNPNITYIVMDNEVYGLTKGQNSPTSHEDLLTKINPYEVIEDRINPVLMALSFNTSYIARGYSDNLDQVRELIIGGIKHEGFSFIHILSPCTQYNTKFTNETIAQRLKPLPADHDKTDRIAGMKLAMTQEPLYTGLFYQINKPTLEQKLNHIRSVALSNVQKDDYSIKDVIKQFQ